MIGHPNLKGWWQLEGNANDSSGNGLNGTVNGSPSVVASGIFGQGYQFDGTASKYISLGNVLNSVFAGSTAKFTIVVHITTPASFASAEFLVAKYADSAFSENQRQFVLELISGRFEFLYTDLALANYQGYYIGSTLATSTKYALAITYDAALSVASRLTGYINGVAQTLTQRVAGGTSFDIQTGTACLGIGAKVSSNGLSAGSNAKCEISNVMVFNTVLSGSDIKRVSSGKHPLARS